MHVLILTVRKVSHRWRLHSMHAPEALFESTDREAVVEAALNRAERAPACRLVVQDEEGGIDFQRRYGPDVWPPHKNETFFYENEGSRNHEDRPA